MSALIDLLLGVVTSVGGFVEVGSISTSAQAGAEFGFELLWAIAIAGLARLPFHQCLGRGRGRRQVGRTRRQRLADPPRVWTVAPAPRNALLVDDVWTTGATLAACAEVLRESGSRRIVALTLARAL